MPRSLVSESVDDYLNAHSSEPDVVQELRNVTNPMKWSMMQIAPSQAAYLSWTVKTLGVKRAIEVGVFTGMSSLVTALAMPKDGYLLACDIDKEWTDIARTHWDKAGVGHKVELIVQPAIKTLHERLIAGEANSYDFAFIDADKAGYDGYYEACLRLVRRGGVIMLDNMLWGGSVARKSRQDESTRALRALNQKIAGDARVEHSLVPVGDGLMLATLR